jgi:hypothetical protein
VQRDLERLSGIFPITCDSEGRTNYWYFTDKSALLQIPAMGDATALALKLAEDYLVSIMPPATLRLLQPYFRHADGVLARTRLGKWRSKVKIIRRGPPLIPPAIRPGVQEAVYEALLDGRQLQVSYKGRGRPEAGDRILNPLGVVVRDGVIYLIATAWDYEDIRHFALHRMSRASVTDLSAKLPPSFDLQKYVEEDREFAYPESRKRIRLVLRFSADAAHHLAESQLSEDQALTPARDGRFKIQATVEDTQELRWWLRGFGDAVEIVAPRNLRSEFKRMVAELNRQYK